MGSLYGLVKGLKVEATAEAPVRYVITWHGRSSCRRLGEAEESREVRGDNDELWNLYGCTCPPIFLFWGWYSK